MFHILIAGVLFWPQYPPAEKKPTQDPPEIVITAKRHESELLDTPTGVTIIRREDLEKTPAHTVVDVLQGRAGLFVTKNSSTPQDSVVDVRGFNNGGGNGQRLLVLVDGRKVNSVSGSQVDWAAIPLENVERIEIVRGPAAALYGDAAVAGVIHIITRRPTKEPSGALEGGFGSFHTLRSSGSFGTLYGPVGIALFAGREASDGFRDNSEFVGVNTTALLTWDLDPEAKAWLKLALHDDDRERPGTLTEAEIDQFGRDGSVTLGDESDVHQRSGDLGIDWEVFGGTLTPAVYVTGDAADSITTFASGTSSADTESRIIQVSVKHVAKGKLLGVDATLVAGLEGTLETADADSRNDFPSFGFVEDQHSQYDRKLWAAYVRAEARLHPDILVGMGIRRDAARIDFERVTVDVSSGTSTTLEGDGKFDNVAPFGSIGWFFTENSSVYASAGRTFRLPNRDELVGFITTSLDLDPERAHVYEIGVRTRECPVLGGSIAVYRMVVHNEIFFVPPPVGEDIFTTGNFGQNRNVDRVVHQGIELELESAPAPTLRFQSAVTIQRTTVESGPFDGKEMPITPNVTASVSGTWSSAFGLAVTLGARHVGERFLLNDLSNEVDPLDAYTIADLRLRWKWKLLTFFFEANNVFGKEYFDNGGIGAGSAGIWGSRQAFIPAPEEHVLAGLTVEF